MTAKRGLIWSNKRAERFSEPTDTGELHKCSSADHTAFRQRRARYYDPDWGRFLQTDPVLYADQMNLYAYVGNDPMNATDPTGLELRVLLTDPFSLGGSNTARHIAVMAGDDERGWVYMSLDGAQRQIETGESTFSGPAAYDFRQFGTFDEAMSAPRVDGPSGTLGDRYPERFAIDTGHPANDQLSAARGERFRESNSEYNALQCNCADLVESVVEPYFPEIGHIFNPEAVMDALNDASTDENSNVRRIVE